MWLDLFRIKPITPETQNHSALRRCLTSFDLVLLGIGAIIGAGVFVLTGIAAATKAGPAINISYVLAGLAALFAALSYAELASSVGGCGSAYSYAYASFGELIAWIIGWALLMEYTVAISSVAIGWSGYVKNILQTMGIIFPNALSQSPAEGGIVNLLAISIVVLLCFFLCIGVKQSARLNAIIVFIKLLAIIIFISVAVNHINTNNWSHYFPFGFNGVAQGAALVFYAYIGFDAVSTAAEETLHPEKSLPIGIIGSVVICTVLYIIVATLLTGIANYSTLNVPSPVADALINLGSHVAAGLVALGAIAGLTSVMLVVYYGLTRIFLAISRDGLLPAFFSRVHPRTQTPIPVIILMGIIIAVIAGLMPLSDAATLVNIGTLSAFTIVCAGVIILRWLHPDLPRPFKLPLNPLIPILGVCFCVYLMLNLPWVTWFRFFCWLTIGIIVYFYYSRRHSLLHK